jgi:uncharacterized membrane protein YgaE (UPF0421/DUF939 family)
VRERRHKAVARLRRSWWSVLQAAAAATIAYSFAEVVLGHERPFFAPIAAVVALNVSVGQRGRRSAEIVVGVALGLIVADLVAMGLGTGPVRMGVVVALAMVAAVVAGGGMLLVNQAAVSALLVVTLQPDEPSFDATRLVDASVGAGVAFAINAAFPHDPRRVVHPAARKVYAELAATLQAIATALERGDYDGTQTALARARGLDAAVAEFREALSTAREMVAVAPMRRRRAAELEPEELAAARADLTVADARNLARGASNAMRRRTAAPPALAQAVAELSGAAGSLASMLAGDSGPEPVRTAALRASELAMEGIEQRPTLASGILAGQVRMAAVDFLASSGLEHSEAVARVEEVSGRAGELPLAPGAGRSG